MTGLDSNILVQLALADHPANAVTVAAAQAEIVLGNKLVFPSLVVAEFLHVSTDARRFAPPLTMTEAVDWIEDFMKNPMVGLVFSTDASMNQTLSWMRQRKLGRKRILDTQLAAILHTNGVRRLLTSNPSDFAVFNVLQVITP
jgi:predicted nucleic acid-binding protein